MNRSAQPINELVILLTPHHQTLCLSELASCHRQAAWFPVAFDIVFTAVGCLTLSMLLSTSRLCQYSQHAGQLPPHAGTSSRTPVSHQQNAGNLNSLGVALLVLVEGKIVSVGAIGCISIRSCVQLTFT